MGGRCTSRKPKTKVKTPPPQVIANPPSLLEPAGGGQSKPIKLSMTSLHLAASTGRHVLLIQQEATTNAEKSLKRTPDNQVQKSTKSSHKSHKSLKTQQKKEQPNLDPPQLPQPQQQQQQPQEQQQPQPCPQQHKHTQEQHEQQQPQTQVVKSSQIQSQKSADHPIHVQKSQSNTTGPSAIQPSPPTLQNAEQLPQQQQKQAASLPQEKK